MGEIRPSCWGPSPVRPSSPSSGTPGVRWSGTLGLLGESGGDTLPHRQDRYPRYDPAVRASPGTWAPRAAGHSGCTSRTNSQGMPARQCLSCLRPCPPGASESSGEPATARQGGLAPQAEPDQPGSGCHGTQRGIGLRSLSPGTGVPAKPRRQRSSRESGRERAGPSTVPPGTCQVSSSCRSR